MKKPIPAILINSRIVLKDLKKVDASIKDVRYKSVKHHYFLIDNAHEELLTPVNHFVPAEEFEKKNEIVGQVIVLMVRPRK